MTSLPGVSHEAFEVPRASTTPAWHAALLAPHVLLASVLGLAPVLMRDGGIFARVWSASLAADGVFVAGTVAGASVAYALARQRHTLLAVAAGWLLTWLVYSASFLLVLGNGAFPGAPAADVLGVVTAVGDVGVAGLVYGALAPPLVALSARR